MVEFFPLPFVIESGTGYNQAEYFGKYLRDWLCPDFFPVATEYLKILGFWYNVMQVSLTPPPQPIVLLPVIMISLMK